MVVIKRIASPAIVKCYKDERHAQSALRERLRREGAREVRRRERDKRPTGKEQKV